MYMLVQIMSAALPTKQEHIGKKGYAAQIKDELLVFGYIRECLYPMNVPRGIDNLILSFLPPAVLKFEMYNSEWFKLAGDGEIIMVRDDNETGRCSGFFAYPECYNNGYDKGVHVWSVKCEDCHDCYRYIGVSSIRCDEYTTFGKNGPEYGWDSKWKAKPNHFLYVEGGYSDWKEDDILTVKLDCDAWQCVWYKNELKHKTTTIQPNCVYFFVAQFCAAKGRYTSLETSNFDFL
eukprot:545789_1